MCVCLLRSAPPLIGLCKVGARSIELSWTLPEPITAATPTAAATTPTAAADRKDWKAPRLSATGPSAAPASSANAAREVAVELAPDEKGTAGTYVEVYRGSGSSCKLTVEPLRSYYLRLRAADETGFGQYSASRLITTPKAGGFDSKILTPELGNKLNELVGAEHEWKLLYRGTRDGFTAVQFHARCDGKGETLSVVQSSTGNVFGGFSPLPWATKGGYFFDKSQRTFIFSLKNSAGVGPFNGIYARSVFFPVRLVELIFALLCSDC